jgi:hypothetical protein
MGKRENDEIHGREAEILFCEIMLSINPNSVIVSSTKEQDEFEHWDFEVDGIKYDVKSEKVLGKLNIVSQEYALLEIENIYGNIGWLFGKADKIAFKYYDSFLISPRLKLVEYNKLHNTRRLVKNIEDAIHQLYRRVKSDRKDLITIVPFDNIIPFSYQIRKENY